MRVKVRIDHWLLVITGFMLKLDDGARTWIQCHYERVHKLCTRCGLIGHTRGQFTHNMEEVELMLFRQRQRIQELHQVQYRFNALQPQFTNELRAYHNRRRRWTTQACFGHVDQTHQQVLLNPSHSEHPDPSTPSTPHSPHAITNGYERWRKCNPM